MKKKTLIWGKGFIGERLVQELKADITTKKIKTYSDILSEIKKYKPQIIINCIGKTGQGNVDGCELELDNTLSANTFIPIMLAEACLRHNIKLIHISSGCIYHYDYKKDSPLTEDKIPDFYHLYYSRTKIYSENVLGELAKRQNILILRVRIPLDNRSNPKNILNKLIKYKTVIDIPNSITYIPDFIESIKHLIKIDAKGIYNTVCKGGLRYPQLLNIYKKYNPKFEYTLLDLKKLNLCRTNLVLSTKKLEKCGFKVRTPQEILEECVKGYIKS